MDAAQIRRLGPMLDRFPAHFDDCFSRRPTREHLAAYVRGLPSDLPRKSAVSEPDFDRTALIG
jgi:hypothetical protein